MSAPQADPARSAALQTVLDAAEDAARRRELALNTAPDGTIDPRVAEIREAIVALRDGLPRAKGVTVRRCETHGHVEVGRFGLGDQPGDFDRCPVPTYQEEPCGEPLGPEATLVVVEAP